MFVIAERKNNKITFPVLVLQIGEFGDCNIGPATKNQICSENPPGDPRGGKTNLIHEKDVTF